MIGFIYIIKNTINNKVYIGQTKTSINQRWKEHIRHAKNGNQIINRAMNKYGSDKFYIEILETCDINDIDNREIYYIEKYDSTNKSKGYNVSIGGNTPKFKRKKIDIELIIDLYINKRNTLEEIANKFNVSRYIINSELKKVNIDIRDRHDSCNKFMFIKKEDLLNAINNNNSIRSAAKSINIPYSTFRKACIYNKIEYNSRTSVRH